MFAYFSPTEIYFTSLPFSLSAFAFLIYMNCCVAIVLAEWVYLFAVAFFLCSSLTLVNEMHFTITMINSSFVVGSFIYFVSFFVHSFTLLLPFNSGNMLLVSLFRLSHCPLCWRLAQLSVEFHFPLSFSRSLSLCLPRLTPGSFVLSEMFQCLGLCILQWGRQRLLHYSCRLHRIQCSLLLLLLLLLRVSALTVPFTAATSAAASAAACRISFGLI